MAKNKLQSFVRNLFNKDQDQPKAVNIQAENAKAPKKGAKEKSFFRARPTHSYSQGGCMGMNGQAIYTPKPRGKFKGYMRETKNA